MFCWIAVLQNEAEIRNSYMCNVNVHEMSIHEYFAETNALSTEPITMLNSMHVTVDRPSME